MNYHTLRETENLSPSLPPSVSSVPLWFNPLLPPLPLLLPPEVHCITPPPALPSLHLNSTT